MSIAHWMIVIGIVALLFGRHKISDLMGDVAQGIKSFKKGMREDERAVKPDDNKPDAPSRLAMREQTHLVEHP
jgi:sec-independent protein translocase protein TatA